MGWFTRSPEKKSRRELRTPAEQQEHETYTAMAREFNGDKVCGTCGEWRTIGGEPVACDCKR